MDNTTSPHIEKLVNWYIDRVLTIGQLPRLDVCPLLLCAKDLALDSFSICRALSQLSNTPIPFDQQRGSIVETLIRQLVLFRFDLALEERIQFLDYWVEKRELRGEDIVTVAYILGVAIEQERLLSSTSREYVRNWFRRHLRINARRVRAWLPRYLSLAGMQQEALDQATNLMKERDDNGSWGGDMRATASIAYALLYSRIVQPESLGLTRDYILRRLSRGFSGQVAHEATVLKLLSLLGEIPPDQSKRLKMKLANENSIFLSHSRFDKPFVRKLASHLQSKGVRIWLDEAEISPGDSIITKIQRGLEEMRYLAVVLSRQSTKSAWVEKELNAALMDSLSSRAIKVIPILIEDCQIPFLLRDTHYADFRGDFEKGFNSLMKTLSPFELGPDERPEMGS